MMLSKNCYYLLNTVLITVFATSLIMSSVSLYILSPDHKINHCKVVKYNKTNDYKIVETQNIKCDDIDEPCYDGYYTLMYRDIDRLYYNTIQIYSFNNKEEILKHLRKNYAINSVHPCVYTQSCLIESFQTSYYALLSSYIIFIIAIILFCILNCNKPTYR